MNPSILLEKGSSHPHFRLIRQTASSQESIAKNGIHKEVHVVVKNTPFILEVSLTQPVLINNQIIDFHHLALDVLLLYDCPNLKAVNYVKSKPHEYKISINETGDKLCVNTRIKVLTSQHEDMFFRVLLRFLEVSTKRMFRPALEVLSEPIKVISKPKQNTKRKRATTKRRTLSDLLVETVQRIEENQKKQPFSWFYLNRCLH